MNHNLIGSGIGSSKRAAEQEAAKKALEYFDISESH